MLAERMALGKLNKSFPLLFSVPTYDASFSERERMMQKVYCVGYAMTASSGHIFFKTWGRCWRIWFLRD